MFIKTSLLILGVLLILSCQPQVNLNDDTQVFSKANANPSWQIEPGCFVDGGSGSFDDIAVKDPSIVYADGAYHLFIPAETALPGPWVMPGRPQFQD